MDASDTFFNTYAQFKRAKKDRLVESYIRPLIGKSSCGLGLTCLGFITANYMGYSLDSERLSMLGLGWLSGIAATSFKLLHWGLGGAHQEFMENRYQRLKIEVQDAARDFLMDRHRQPLPQDLEAAIQFGEKMWRECTEKRRELYGSDRIDEDDGYDGWGPWVYPEEPFN